MDSNVIYLDANSTVPIRPGAESVLERGALYWANPSSLSKGGRLVRVAIEKARENLAQLAGVTSDQIIFTSGATEANITAIHAACIAYPKRKHIVTSVVEHSSILKHCDYLNRNHGFRITKLGVDFEGMISESELMAALEDPPAIVSLILANNETGRVWPVADYAKLCQQEGVLFHTDAVQAFGKIQLPDSSGFPDFVTVSAHKLGGVKGCGALILRDPNSFTPMFHGGNQEWGNRGGTENVLGILCFGAAILELLTNKTNWAQTSKFRDKMEVNLLAKIPLAQVHCRNGRRLPNTSSIYIPGVESQALVTYLDSREIIVSSGSACMETALTPSHVIQALASYETATETIRVSLTPETTGGELSKFVDVLLEATELIG